MTPAAEARPPAAIAAALRLVDGLCVAGAAVAAVSAALLALILIGEVVVTSFFAWSQPWAVEYTIFLQCFVLFCGSGWALRQGGHIRVSVLLQALPPRASFALDAVATALTIGVLFYAVSALWPQTIRSFDFGSVSYFPMGTPLWIPQLLLTLGVTLLLLAFLARLVRLLYRMPPDLGAGLGGGGHE